MEIYEAHNGEHWHETINKRPLQKLYGGDVAWFILGHILLLPLVISVLLLTTLALPLYWLWDRLRRPSVKNVHGEVLRLLGERNINAAFERGILPDAMPEISVVIPFYNRAEWVDRIVRSVLNQTFDLPRTVEIIAVDNNSTDRTAERLSEYPVRLVKCLEKGPGAARNAGIKAARAPIVAFIDSDCLADNYWLQNLMFAFEDADVMFAGGQIVTLEVDEFVARFTNDNFILNNGRFFEGAPYFPRFFATANAAYRRSALDQVGGFNSKMWMSEDADLSARVLNLDCKMAYVHNSVVYHQHRDTLTGLWGQAVDYGSAAVAMFAEHKRDLYAHVAISWKNIRDIAWSPVTIIHHLVIGKTSYERTREILYALWRLGFTWGCLKGCLRHRVVFF